MIIPPRASGTPTTDNMKVLNAKIDA